MKLERGISFPAINPDSRPLLAGQESVAYGPSSRYQGWQRAMEQAELASWFKGGDGEREREEPATHQATVKTASLAPPGARYRALASHPQDARYTDNVAQVHVGTQEMMQPNVQPLAEAGSIPAAEAGAAEPPRDLTLQAQHLFVPAMIPSTDLTSTGSLRGEQFGAAMVPPTDMTSTRSSQVGQFGLGMVTAPNAISTVPPPVELLSALVSQLRAAISASASGGFDAEVVVPTRADIAAMHPVAPGMPSPAWTVGEAQPEDAMQSLDEHESPPASGKQEATASAESSPAVRIHAEWTEQGVRIWLGVSRDESAVLPEVQRQLDRLLAESGHQLLSLVCNGRPLTGTAQGDLAKRIPLARLHEGQYRQVLQDGDWSAGQPMFHIYQQVGR